MKSKKSDSLTFALFCGFLVFMLLLFVMLPEKDFSEKEKRYLASAPELTWETLLSGSYGEAVETYLADHVPGRDLFVGINSYYDRLSGRQVAEEIYTLSDQALVEAPVKWNRTQAEKNIGAVQRFADTISQQVDLMLVPSAGFIQEEKMKLLHDPYLDDLMIEEIYSMTGDNISCLNLIPTYEERAEEELYYNTDHHWTSLGAYYAFQEIAPLFNIQPTTLEDYTVYPVSTSFEGTLSSKSGSHGALDTVEIYVPNSPIDYYVTYADGEIISSLYKRDALEQKDHYTVFFGGNYSRVDITTTANTGRCLLIFKDSYANCMVQFLYPYFDHITMIDPRYYYDNLELVITSESITDVLFLYNADTFLGDTSLADVLVSE